MVQASTVSPKSLIHQHAGGQGEKDSRQRAMKGPHSGLMMPQSPVRGEAEQLAQGRGPSSIQCECNPCLLGFRSDCSREIRTIPGRILLMVRCGVGGMGVFHYTAFTQLGKWEENSSRPGIKEKDTKPCCLCICISCCFENTCIQILASLQKILRT